MADIFIDIDEEFAPHAEADRLRQAVAAALRAHHPRPETASLTLTITTDDTVRQLNRQYRGIDAPTDVLSFENAPDPDFPDVDPTLAGYLGDIIIAWPVAQAQAQRGGHPVAAELLLLAVHGALHLLGFDHHTAADKAAMWAAQQQIMAQFGLAHIQPTET